jgi:hypothetical protein
MLIEWDTQVSFVILMRKKYLVGFFRKIRAEGVGCFEERKRGGSCCVSVFFDLERLKF